MGGRWRGLKLTPPGRGDDAARLRPTADRVRESLFNILISSGAALEDARVLDLFAGTGALGLEALSRGALHATFIDSGRRAQALIRANLALTGGDGLLLPLDATRLPPNAGAPFDLIFLDPPYGRRLGEPALIAAHTGGWLSPNATVVWEEAAPQAPPPGFRQTDQRRWGDTVVTLLASTAPDV